MIKKCAVLIVTLCVAVLMSGCYRIETSDIDKYNEFYQRMKEVNTSIGKGIPTPTDDMQIEEMYLYYSDWDLVDTMYAVYVNCTYAPEKYEQAKNAAYAISRTWGDPQSNSPSFDCESVVGTGLNNMSKGGTNQYAYILFEDANRRIVYVYLFEDALTQISKNIPDEYLPKELREFQDT